MEQQEIKKLSTSGTLAFVIALLAGYLQSVS